MLELLIIMYAVLYDDAQNLCPSVECMHIGVLDCSIDPSPRAHLRLLQLLDVFSQHRKSLSSPPPYSSSPFSFFSLFSTSCFSRSRFRFLMASGGLSSHSSLSGPSLIPVHFGFPSGISSTRLP